MQTQPFVRWLFVVAIATVSCNETLPVPKMTQQPTQALTEVPYPPPPARVEAVPDSPREGAKWIDGEWVWRHKRWLWVRGRWIVPPRNAKFSPWTMVRNDHGELFWARGTWRDARGQEIAEPPPLATGSDIVGAVVDANGNTLEPGRVLSPPGQRRRRP